MTEKTVAVFHSKKNRVSLVDIGGLQVKKEYADFAAYAAELRELELLRGMRVPAVLKEYPDRKTVYMTYIDGVLLLDEYLRRGADEAAVLAERLADFLLEFYRRRACMPADLTFRNFIIKDGLCFGIDFEEPPRGNALDCAAKLSAFCFLYEGELRKKTAFCAALLKRLNLKNGIAGAEEQIRFLCDRRGLPFDAESVGLFLRELKRVSVNN